MDRDTELLLQKAARSQNWEDQERGSYDVETLKNEFNSRLQKGDEGKNADTSKNGNGQQ